MNTTFVFDRPVSGKNFVGRSKEISMLCNFLSCGESFAIYGEPGCGKDSLLLEALTRAKMNGVQFRIADISFMNARTTGDFVLRLVSGIIKAVSDSPSEYENIVRGYLTDTGFVFDLERYEACGDVVNSKWELTEADIRAAFGLASSLAKWKGERIVVVIRQFQNILFSRDEYMLLREMEKVVNVSDRSCPFVFIGSHFNAMREIFDVRKLFWHSVVRVIPRQMDFAEITDFISRGFQMQGKVLEKELILLATQILRGNMRYMAQLFMIVDSMSRGFISKNIVEEAVWSLVSIHQPRFFSTVCSLTDFQISLLKAVIDGQTRFSSSAVIEKYALNSSANIRRIKDALTKKEVLWFDEKDDPHIQDPLFELWLRKEYFAG